jgi:hypothetical protein
MKREIIGFLFAVVLLVLVIGLFPFQSERLDAIAQNIFKTYADECEVGRIRLSLFRGVLIRNVRMTKKLHAATSYHVRVPLVQLKWSVPSLFLKKIIIKDVAVVKPVITVDVNPKAAGPAPREFKKQYVPFSELTRQLDWPVLINRFVVGKGTIIIVKDGFRLVRANSVQMKLRFRKGRKLNCRGWLGAQSVIAGGQWAMTHVQSKLLLYHDKLSLKFLEGKIYGGKAAGDISLLLFSNRINRFRLSVSNMALAKFYKAWKGRKGYLGGRVHGSLAFEPGVIEQNSLRGKGHVEINWVYAKNIALQRNFPKKDYVPLFNPISFAKVQGNVDINQGKIHMRQWTGQGRLADFSLSGWLDYKGVTVQRMRLALSKQLCEELPGLVNYSLVTLPGGKKRLRLIVAGPLADPDVVINEKLFKRTVKRAFRGLKRSLKKIF